MTHREAGIVVPGDAKSASTADLNADGKPDLVVTINTAPTVAFENRSTAKWVRVALPAANAPGARVTLARPGSARQTIELHAGSGFLGQEPATAWFGLGASSAPGSIHVVWPNGTETKAAFDGKTPSIKVEPPQPTARR